MNFSPVTFKTTITSIISISARNLIDFNQFIVSKKQRDVLYGIFKNFFVLWNINQIFQKNCNFLLIVV